MGHSRLKLLLERTDGYVRSFAEMVAQRNKDRREREQDTLRAARAAAGDEEPDEDDLDLQNQTEVEALLQQDIDTSDSKQYYKMAHSMIEKIDVQPTTLIGGKLKHYQVQGLEWMVSLYNNHLNGILADEMGLGKTIQSIALITYLVEIKKLAGHFLIVVPLSTISNWTLEFLKWAPELRVIAYKGGKAERAALDVEIKKGNFNVVLTTYELVIINKAILSKPRWQYLLIDEGHRLRNTESKLVKTLNEAFDIPRRLLLTGTPLQNSLPELWGLMNFLLPDIFNSSATFEEWFSRPFENSGGELTGVQQAPLNAEEKTLVIRSLHKVLRPFLLRRVKSEVESQLPQKTEHLIKVPMSRLQLAVYKQIKNNSTILEEGQQQIKAGASVYCKQYAENVCNNFI
ncbi:hypothetical protein SARC_01610 [Sphaeroforma arctica JP610]|uniref:Helicase ATP-binding domain-containing protein n=1 Tax=Sphaeroforma arctica JP610 TaxID=667725 RepID=A0A0L0GB58_9EUKA|nr:hypothetical protein SARC_01610 [Sphaeroforma arctica JP610]KNC86235.1 hypothetical protein SARC_01610 [Sphaeroforma arctica JP610]|eukprot:XP_014160137.1 hypothetical protein SARC_01610 [Sphaeroforma arctica JP610]